MKKFFSCMGIAFTIIGSVIGAGFITGAEIVSFFSATFLLPACFLLFLLLAFFFYSMLESGWSVGGQKVLNKRVLGRFSRLFDGVMLSVSFVSLCGMCAGADAVIASFFGFNTGLPIASFPMLLLSLFVCKKGVKGIKIFNLFLVPLMIAVVLFSCASAFEPSLNAAGVKVLPVFLYTGLNCFMSSPVIIDSGKGADRRVLLPAAVTASLIISVCVYFIMQKISTGYGTDENLPLLSAFSADRIFYCFFSVITLFGIITTLVSSHYPLVRIIEENPRNRVLNAILILFAAIASRVGFHNIVNVAYPIIGVVGLVYSAILSAGSVRRLFSSPHHGFFKEGNERVHSGGKQTQY